MLFSSLHYAAVYLNNLILASNLTQSPSETNTKPYAKAAVKNFLLFMTALKRGSDVSYLTIIDVPLHL